jgi:hypothetical protein
MHRILPMTVLVLAIAPATVPAAPLGRLVFTITKSTASCGGRALNLPPLPPFSGEVDNPDGTVRSGLGLGCLYFGGGRAGTFPGTAIPDGGRSVLGVKGVSLTGVALTLGADPGSGPADCTPRRRPGSALPQRLDGHRRDGRVHGGCELPR